MDSRLEMWGGVECTVNRVGDSYYDQLARTGHWNRPGDLDLFAELNIRTLRYPVLWEHVSPQSPTTFDWEWADQRLNRIKALGIEPIIGLLHHGSGPRYTDLSDADFPELFADYASHVAARYPWVRRFTPINEPLTTARFSGLYGLWYPHRQDDGEFLRMAMNQCRAIAMAMAAIRKIRPDAELVLTEDLGQMESTPALAYQNAHENQRRWLSMDLLAGRVTPAHPFYRRLRSAGIPPDALAELATGLAKPNIIGINHYVSSNRFIDERLHRYPLFSHGGNGRDVYADVEAARVAEASSADRADLLRQVWLRYATPLALTECHLYCTREEQMRWLRDGWIQAQALRAEGIDVQAVTAWSLLGAFDWTSLCVQPDGDYEPGVFDLRSGRPRPTALAKMVRGLARDGQYDHPVLDQPGWWQRPIRFLYPAPTRIPSWRVRSDPPAGSDRLLLIVGSAGRFARVLASACEVRALPYRLVSHREMEASSRVEVSAMLAGTRPWAVINAAGYSDVDGAEVEVDLCMRDNRDAAAVLAGLCAEQNIPFATFSTDLVFDGEQSQAYLESQPTNPINIFGYSKVQAEAAVLAACRRNLIFRPGFVFYAWDHRDFLARSLDRLAQGLPVSVPDDIYISPAHLPEVLDHCLDLLIDGEAGVWHLTHQESLSCAEFVRLVARTAGLNFSLVEGKPAGDFTWQSQRPRLSALATERGALLKPISRGIDNFLAQYQRRTTAAHAQQAVV